MKKHIQLFLIGLATISVPAKAQVNPIELGRSSNAFTIIHPEQNQVAVQHESNSVLFIHQQDVTIWGGGSTENGKLRYDLSTDGGSTFNTDLGPMQQIYTNYSRFPMATFYGTDANPYNNKMVWASPSNRFPTPGWIGVAAGVSDIVASNPTSSTEHYIFDADPTHTVGGLCQGLAGEFWMTEMMRDGANYEDSVSIYKGTYNSITQDVDWALHGRKFLDYALTYDGTARVVEPNMAFSPDGQTGWLALLGDVVGGSDSTYNPIFLKSTDAGATWSDAIEVDLRTASFTSSGTLEDELTALWENFPVDPSSGRPTCSFDFDITVDQNGDPHLFVVVGSASTQGSPLPSYIFQSGLAKLAVDITSSDGGQTWSMNKVAPVYTFRGEFGTPDPNTGSLLPMDNYTQISRTESGSHIFYSWVDSDTAVFTGSMNGIGFGESDNLAPNLRIAGKRISDGYVTCPKWITNGDFIWEGRALFPTMAPEVLISSGNTYKLPIVALDMIVNDQWQPCRFWYFGNDATITESDFWGEAAWVNTDDCFTNPTVSISERNEMEKIGLFPVPTPGSVWLTCLNSDLYNTVEVYNNFGQLVYSDVVRQTSQTELNLSDLSDGLYSVRVISEKGMVVKPLVVTH